MSPCRAYGREVKYAVKHVDHGRPSFVLTSTGGVDQHDGPLEIHARRQW